MSPDRVVKTTLVIDDRGSVKVLRGVGDEAGKTEGKLSHLDRSTRGLGKTFSGLKGMLAGGLGLVGAGGLLFGLTDVISKTKSVAEETEKFHSITGAGTQASLRYSQALKARGLDSEALTRAFGFLDKNVRSAELQEKKFGQTQEKSGAATTKASAAQEKSSIAVEKARLSLAKAERTGKAYTIMQAQLGLKSAEAGTKVSAASAKAAPELGRQAKALGELGIKTAEYVKLKPEDKIKTVTKAFENLAAGEKKTRLERELFGKGGNALSVVLEKNGLSLNATADKVEKYFGVIHGGQKGQEELLAKQAEAKLAFEGLEFQLGTKLTPVLIKVFEWFSKVSLEVSKGTGVFGEIKNVAEGVWNAFSTLVGPSNALSVAIGGIAAGFVAMKVGNILALGKAIGIFGGEAALVNPEIAALALSLLGIYEAIKHSGEIEKFIQKNVPGFEKASPATIRAHATRGGRGSFLGTGGHTGFHGSPLAGLTGAVGGPAYPTNAGGLGAGTTRGDSAVGPTGPEHSKVELHVDGHKLAETLLHNPRARREIAEASAIYSHSMAARGHG